MSLLVIRVYRVTVGPMLGVLSSCRYDPTCSVYGYAAVERFGFRRGWWLAIRRVSRCAPWGGSGYDPVPDEYVSWREARRRKHAMAHPGK